MNGWFTQNISTASYYTVVTSGLSCCSVWLWSIHFSSRALNKIQRPRTQCKPFRGEILNQFPQIHSFIERKKRKKEKRKKLFFMNVLKKRNWFSWYYLWQIRETTFPITLYTGIKISKYEFHMHIKNTTIAFIHHSFLEHLLCSGHYLYPEDTMNKSDSTKNLYECH